MRATPRTAGHTPSASLVPIRYLFGLDVKDMPAGQKGVMYTHRCAACRARDCEVTRVLVDDMWIYCAVQTRTPSVGSCMSLLDVCKQLTYMAAIPAAPLCPYPLLCLHPPSFLPLNRATGFTFQLAPAAPATASSLAVGATPCARPADDEEGSVGQVSEAQGLSLNERGRVGLFRQACRRCWPEIAR